MTTCFQLLECLQPENILLGDDFSIKISDFGFAVLVAHDEEIDTGGLTIAAAFETILVAVIDIKNVVRDVNS